MKIGLQLLCAVVIILGLSGCIEIKQPHTKLPPGIWRGVLMPDKVIPGNERISDEDIMAGKVKFETVALGELPFNFEVIYATKDSFYIVIHNGEERIQVTDITYGLDRRTAKDTLTINFPIYNTKIVGIYEESVFEGEWIDMNRENYSIPFAAFFGKDYRFTEMRKPPVTDLSGKWQVTFGTDRDTTTPGIGEFSQNGNNITGTFILETGDYRFLEGTVQGNKMYMSTFDGAVAYLFEAKIMEDGTLQGVFRAGKHYKSTWEASRNEEATLTNPTELTRPSGKIVQFTFQDHTGANFQFETKGQPAIIQIMGSWCRNCYDESIFLKDLQKEIGKDKFQIVSLAFEYAQDSSAALKRLERYRERLGLDYPVLLAGLSADKSAASDKLPFLTTLKAFPTTVFVDKNGAVRKVYTGIYGPASQQHESYTNEIRSTIVNLIKE